MDISVLVCSCGSDRWRQLAQEAVASVSNKDCEIISLHDEEVDNISITRNKAAKFAQTPWICFLDADDTFAPCYISEMNKAIRDNGFRDAIYRPATIGIYKDGTVDEESIMIPRKNLLQANFIVIGAVIDRERFLEVGCFDESLPALEDWDLWIRLTRTGSDIIDVRNSIYQVHVNDDGRNSSEHSKAYSIIRKRYL